MREKEQGEERGTAGVEGSGRPQTSLQMTWCSMSARKPCHEYFAYLATEGYRYMSLHVRMNSGTPLHKTEPNHTPLTQRLSR